MSNIITGIRISNARIIGAIIASVAVSSAASFLLLKPSALQAATAPVPSSLSTQSSVEDRLYVLALANAAAVPALGKSPGRASLGVPLESRVGWKTGQAFSIRGRVLAPSEFVPLAPKARTAMIYVESDEHGVISGEAVGVGETKRRVDVKRIVDGKGAVSGFDLTFTAAPSGESLRLYIPAQDLSLRDACAAAGIDTIAKAFGPGMPEALQAECAGAPQK